MSGCCKYGVLAIVLSTLTLPVAFGQQIDRRIAPFFEPPVEFAGDLGGLRSPLKFDDGTEVKSAADWQKRRAEIRRAWHELMGPWPAMIEKPTIEYLEKETRDNFTQHHVRVEVAPQRFGDDVYLLVPEGKGPFPAVIVVFYDGKSGIGRGKTPQCDFAYQLARRGFVTLSVGGLSQHYPDSNSCQLQPLSFLAYQAANCCNALACLEYVDGNKIGIVGHSFGGKWAMFASCLYDKFACAVWSDGGIVFDEQRANVNYWEPWYLGFETGKEQRNAGVVTDSNPRTGAYKQMVESGRNLHELHALMAPRPLLVSGGSEDQPERWRALNHTVQVNKLLGAENRVAMTNRAGHNPTAESNEQVYAFFAQFLQGGSLQGTWLAAAVELAGNKFPDEIRQTIKLVINGDNYTATVGTKVDKGTAKLNPSAVPKTLDITSTDGPHKGKTILAIYELNGDTLRVCYDLSGKNYPTEFKTAADTPLFLVTYQREKP